MLAEHFRKRYALKKAEQRGRVQQSQDGRVTTHRFEPLVLVLTLLVIPVVIIEESDAASGFKDAAAMVNWLIWVGFLAELTFVLWVAPRKWGALKAHWLEVWIVVLTPPFLPALLSTLRFARLTRLLRQLRRRVRTIRGRAVAARWFPAPRRIAAHVKKRLAAES